MRKKKQDTKAVLARNLRRLMRSGRGPASQEDLAVASGLTQPAISVILARKHAAKIDTLDQLARPYGLSAARLLDPDLDVDKP